MTIHDQLETARDAGFTRVMDARDARRQLHASAAIVSILGLAALIVLSTPPAPRFGTSAPVKLTVQEPQIAHMQQAFVKVRPGS